jgi:hypothetical protein
VLLSTQPDARHVRRTHLVRGARRAQLAPFLLGGRRRGALEIEVDGKARRALGGVVRMAAEERVERVLDRVVHARVAVAGVHRAWGVGADGA